MGSRVLHVLALAATAAALLAANASAAAPDIKALFGTCPSYGADRICTAQVPSFDGASLDVDLTLPAPGTSGPHPLIVMLHGFGNDKHEWESLTDAGDGADKHQWNSHWFAGKGYYVLTYTARGFCTRAGACAAGDGQPQTPAGTSAGLPDGTLHLKSREFEIRDTQWLAALVARSYDVDPHRLAVTGGSYGGGESWVQASQARWTFPHSVDAALPVLDLRVAVPKYPWTDLAYSLAPNGHGGGPRGDDLYESSQGAPGSDDGAGSPVGVPKESYVGGFFAIGATEGIFEAGTTQPTYAEGPIDIPAWNARVLGTGDPYDVAGTEDPVVRQVRRGLTEFRSSYYQDEGWAAQARPGARKVAVFSIQGWTDDLFPALESFRQFKYLKRLDPKWPVSVAVADVGHARAQNKGEVWRALNERANRWLDAENAAGPPRAGAGPGTPVISYESTCPNDAGGDTGLIGLGAETPEGLATGTLTVAFAAGGSLANPPGVEDPNGPATDPALGGALGHDEPCRVSPGPAAGGWTATSQPLPDSRRYAGLGFVRVPYTLTGAPTATLQARVWDVAPDGKTLLVTRGAYRIDTPAYDQAAGTLRLPLFGNHWRFRPGHRIRLDLTQVDHPAFRPSTLPSSIAFSAPRLVLPTREITARTVPGA